MCIYVYITRRNTEDNYDLPTFGIKMLAVQDLDLTKMTACLFQICKDNYTELQTERAQNQNPLIGKFCDCNRKDTVLLSNSHYLFKFFFLI